MSLQSLTGNFIRQFSTEHMSIELQATDSPLLKANGVSPMTSNSSNGASGVVRSGGTFGEVLNTQAALFKMEDGKQSLNSAKLLSPDILHANQIVAQSKAYSQSNGKSIHAFEANIHQAEYILAMKNIAEYKQSTSNLPLASAIDKMGRHIVRVDGFSPMLSATNLPSSGTGIPRTSNQHYKTDQPIFDASRNVAVTSEEADEAELLAKGEGSHQGQFFQDSPRQRNPHSQDSDEPSLEELEAMGALNMNVGSNTIQDWASSEPSNIQLQMQSSLSSPEWIAELAQKTIVMFGSDKHTAVITLNSSDKGSLKIILRIQGDQVSASFYSHDSDVLDKLQMGSSDLKSSMLEAGLVLSELNIHSDSGYPQNESAVKTDLNSVDSKLDLADLHSAKFVNFYV